MNLILILFIIKILVLLVVARFDSLSEDVVEKFYWTPKNNERDIQWEFAIIGKRVAWSVGKILCSSPGNSPRIDGINEEFLEETLTSENSTRERKNVMNSGLAILDDDDVRLWLSRMLSESNYRYDGLWIGGHRDVSKKNWTWIRTVERDEIPIASSSLHANYPDWYKISDALDHEKSKNCLIFERTGHDLPVLVPADCQLRKPFVCSRIVTKKIPETIAEGMSVSVDGYRYTILSVDEGEETSTYERLGARRLNGGGVKWIEARHECRKRGKYLAMVMSNEAAQKIAYIMLKNRPSMESVWLGGWSVDGTDWTWSTTGFVLSSTRSSASKYPPWLNGHPIASSIIDEHYKRHGRCLTLDRHLCPDHVSPVFLDLDCEKKRPFVCQDEIPGRRSARKNIGASVNRRISIKDRILEFSMDRMTWNEGQAHCAKNNGRIASILDSKTLSAVLERMTDLYLDHVWVGGKTLKTSNGWRWFDETGKALTRKGIGIRVSWCLGDEESALPKAEPNDCLNLDREGHGLPLFYGLSCNFTKQHVLCAYNDDSPISENSPIRTDEKNISPKSAKPEDFASRNRKSALFSPTIATAIPNDADNEKSSATVDNRRTFEGDLSSEDIANTTNSSFETDKIVSGNDTNEFGSLNRDTSRLNATSESKKNKRTEKGGSRLADLDEETKKLLVASGYNISDSDLILGLELELVDLADNSTSRGINENPSPSRDNIAR